MPIAAIASAAVAIGVAGASVAATGIAAITAVGALEVVAAVGATLGAIGAVTKDKTLSLVGLGLGLVGGVGALATSAGLFGSEAASTALFGPTAAPATSTFTAGAAGSDITSAATDVTRASGDVAAGEAASLAPAAEPGSALGVTASPPYGVAPADPTKVIGAQATAASDLPVPPIPPASPPPLPTAAATSGASTPSDGSWAAGWPTPAGPAGAVGDDSVFMGALKKIAGLSKDYPALALGTIQAGGSFLSGLTSTLTPAQVNELTARAGVEKATAALSLQQQANLAMPKAVASNTPITGTPTPIVNPAVSQGLINRGPVYNGIPA